MEGYGTNENEVINVLTTVDFNQRKLIEEMYKRLFKRVLTKQFLSQFRLFQTILVASFTTSTELGIRFEERVEWFL